MSEYSSRKYNNSAIGSWSGYIYQGLCAAYVALHKIWQQAHASGPAEEKSDLLLYLDAYEDFSIHEEEDNIAISLHQCKLHRDKTNFSEALDQMKTQRDVLRGAGLCNDKTKMYFHTNHDIDLTKHPEVESYEGHEGKTIWTIQKVTDGIRYLVRVIYRQKCIPGSVESACCRIYALVDTKVLEIESEAIEDRKPRLVDLARRRESAIRLSAIEELLDDVGFGNYSKEEFSRLLRYHLLNNLESKMEGYETPEDWEDLNPDNVFALRGHIQKLGGERMSDIMQRINPDVPVTHDLSSLMDMVNSSICTQLIKLVGSLRIPASENIDWTVGESFISPSLSSDEGNKAIIKSIFRNRANLDCLREYDWLVGLKVRGKVEDIHAYARSIMDVDDRDKDEMNIFKEKKIGILSPTDFNELAK